MAKCPLDLSTIVESLNDPSLPGSVRQMVSATMVFRNLKLMLPAGFRTAFPVDVSMINLVSWYVSCGWMIWGTVGQAPFASMTDHGRQMFYDLLHATGITRMEAEVLLGAYEGDVPVKATIEIERSIQQGWIVMLNEDPPEYVLTPNGFGQLWRLEEAMLIYQRAEKSPIDGRFERTHGNNDK